MKSILTVIGTRPEAIKLAPILLLLDKKKGFTNMVCVTRQHTDLLDPLLSSLKINVDYQFDNIDHEGSLHKSAARILEQFSVILKNANPDLVLVQGDTTTAFVAALAAFYSRIPVAHVEAGLRTGDLYSPWPEEMHRCLIDKLTNYFFAPTQQAQNALIGEGVPPEKIWVVGNTSIDAVRLAQKTSSSISTTNQKDIVVTIHRRENHGSALIEVCHALRSLAEQFPHVQIIVFLHPNPAISKPITANLSNVQNISLLAPVDHSAFIRLLRESAFIITDSGGVQEEASFMGKPVLVIRNTTERPEGIQAGTARLVGTKSKDIVAACKELLENAKTLASMSRIHFPYGDGHAADRIVNILEKELVETVDES